MKRGHARAKNSSGTWPASSLPPFSPRASQPQPQPLPYFSPRASQPQLYPPQPQPQASRALWRAPHWAPGQRPPQVHCGASASAVQDARAASHATRRSRSARSGSARPVRRAPPLSRVLKASSWPRRRPRPQLLGILLRLGAVALRRGRAANFWKWGTKRTKCTSAVLDAVFESPRGVWTVVCFSVRGHTVQISLTTEGSMHSGAAV